MFGYDISSFALISARQRRGFEFSSQVKFDRVPLVFLFFVLQVSGDVRRVSAQTVRLERGTVLHFDCTRDISKYPNSEGDLHSFSPEAPAGDRLLPPLRRRPFAE